jgi:hypothetical protein
MSGPGVTVEVSSDREQYTITVGIRKGRNFVAVLPRDVMPLELTVFLHRVREVIRRKWRDPEDDGSGPLPDDAGPVRGHG